MFRKLDFISFFFVFFFVSIPFYSPHSHPLYPHSHPDFLRSHLDSLCFHPDSPRSHPNSPRSHPDSTSSHPTPYSVPSFPIPAFTDSQLFASKKDRVSHPRKFQNKNFSVISKYHIFINFLAQKDRIFHPQEIHIKSPLVFVKTKERSCFYQLPALKKSSFYPQKSVISAFPLSKNS